MKKSLLNLSASALLLASLFTGCSAAVDAAYEVLPEDTTRVSYDVYRPMSQMPPGNIAPENVPQFIIFGWDDNQYADGMHNILNIYKDLKNPAGNGNAATFDGTPARSSFYVTPSGTQMVAPETIQSWKDAYTQGHEIGNHTYTHQHGLQFTQAQWSEEIKNCNDFLINTLGIPKEKITGFRTPFLEYNPNLYPALKEHGFEYDNSFEGGWRFWPREDGSTLYWPFTMDDGKPAGSEARDFGKVPGMWQMPTDCVFFYEGTELRRVTGFDYNVWFSISATKAKFLEILKFSLDQKYYGNRSPMNFGTHTNYYSVEGMENIKQVDPASMQKLTTTIPERIAAIDEFLKYALTYPDVRVVTTQQALEWVKNPVPLVAGATKFTITAVAGANGSVTPASAEVSKGTDAVFTVAPDAGYVIDKAYLDGAEVTVVNNEYTVTNVQKNMSFNVTFKAEGTQTSSLSADYTITQDWGTGFGANIVVKNISTAPVNSWKVTVIYRGNQKVSGWGGVVTQNGQVVTVVNQGWNGTIQPGATVSIGLNGNYTGVNDIPVVTAE